MIRVDFPDVEALKAAVEAVAKANSETGRPDDSGTAIFRAERVLDSALLGVELLGEEGR